MFVSLSVYAVDVIINPYRYLNYDDIQAYHYDIEKSEDGCNCECYDDEF